MPGRADPNVDAAVLLERRRAQNRMAQHRFRQKKLAAAKAKALSSSSSSSSQSGGSTSPPPSAPTQPAGEQPTPAAVGGSSGSTPFATFTTVPESLPTYWPITPTEKLLPSGIPSPCVDLFTNFDRPSSTQVGNSSAGTNSFGSSPESLSTTHESTSSARSDSTSSPETCESFRDNNDHSIDMCSLPLSNNDGINSDMEVIQSSFQQHMHESYYPSTSSNGPNNAVTLGSPRNEASGKPGTMPGFTITDSYLSYELAQTLTHEKGLLAVILLQSGSPSVEALRSAILNPGSDRTFTTQFPFARAFYHNAVTIGFLDNDLRASAGGISRISTIWPERSAPCLAGQQNMPMSSTDASNEPPPDPAMRRLWSVPTSLGSWSENRRVASLKENPHMHPTKLQMEHPHSILIDTLPWPNVRDALIRLCLAGVTDGHQIKCDLIGRTFNCMGDGHTFTIHGDDPCDAESWEISESFAQRYSMILDKSIIKRTNFWRRLRGLPNLDIGQTHQKAQTDWLVSALMNASATLL